MASLEFSTSTKRKAFDRSGARCELCGSMFGLVKGPEYDHRLPKALGGTNDLSNCMAICVPCHASKTATEDVPRIRKADRQKARHVGAVTVQTPVPRRPKQAREIKATYVEMSATSMLSGIWRRFK